MILCWVTLFGGSITLNASAEPARRGGADTFPPAPGPYICLGPSSFSAARSFRSDDRVVMTHYFYWYDIYSRSHIINGNGSDAMTTHPATLHDFSYKSVRWHKTQFSDMMAAGIDVALPVYWGAPSERAPHTDGYWSFVGLAPMVQAAEQLRREGKQPPRIGLFYDTSTLQVNSWGQHVDLTTDYGKQWFYASIRDFYSMIPPHLWAMIDDKPIIGLYAAEFAKAHDQSCIDYVRAQFPKDFGGRTPYIIREASWRVQADNVYAWGGAVNPNVQGIGELGPGYDHSNVPGRKPLVVPRDGGKFYENGWLKILRRAPHIVAIETWNEYHEGTDIANSREYGRQYINLTRKYVDLFKQSWKPPRLLGKYTGAKSVEVILGRENQENGVRQVESDDGITVAAVAGGKECRATRPSAHSVRYIYFAIDDSFKWADTMGVLVEVEYFDGAQGRFILEYDSNDPTAMGNGAYKSYAGMIALGGNRTWKTARFAVRDARFARSQNADADFRLTVDAGEFFVRRVAVRRLLTKDEPPPAGARVKTGFDFWRVLG